MIQHPKIDIIPRIFKLQWHITEHCNFRCSHCYQENYDTPEMSLEQMEGALKQYVELMKKWRIPREHASITITGGEPFLYKDFFKFLEKIHQYSPYFQWGILSNGSLLTRENAKKLRLFKIRGYQVSLEGMEYVNDKIRGAGNFKKAIEGIKILIDEGIGVIVSLTATKENVNDVFPLAYFLAKMGVRILWVRRLVPWGNGSQMIDSLLEPREILKLYRKAKEVNGDLLKKGLTLEIPPGCENSFFWSDPKMGEYCAIIRGEILTLLPNGDIYPCRRLPVKIGNILEESFEEIYYSDKIKEIRNPDNFPQYCRENCAVFNNCFGGAKCITYAYSGRFDIPDIQCPRIYKKIDVSLRADKNFAQSIIEDAGKNFNREIYKIITQKNKLLKTRLEELRGIIIKHLSDL